MILFEQILSSQNLQDAWQRVKRNKGAAGVDGLSIADYPKWIYAHWGGIKIGLEQGYYCPLPVKRIEIPKPNGGIRLLGIPSVNDRVIQQAICQALQPIIDPQFSDHSHGFRPNRNAHQAVKAVQRGIKDGYSHAVDIDLSKFFDEVDHDLLMDRVSKWVDDPRVLALIGKYLRAGVSINGKVEASLKGVPQGSPLSPLLANIMLNDLDRYLESKSYRFARYADDFVISVKSLVEGERIKAEVVVFLETLKLPINEEKSQVVPIKQLSFLGFIFKGKKIIWSPKSLANFKHRIRELTGRSWGISWVYRYQQLRRYIVGWMNYFGLSEYYRPVPLLDQWIRRRVRMCYLKQWRKPRTRIRNLIRLGVSKMTAIRLGLSSKGYYRLAKTKAVQMGLNNDWLTSQGLISVQQQWSKFHYS
ncbi:MAG TPA: group II intron reverse transcriptase/maturase [Methyloprofundus sp.]|nr:group II intron reverse transcriptase/maturase [Methyloprofundus sp.]